MDNKKINLKKLLADSITLEEFSKQFTEEDNKFIEREIIYYEVLMSLRKTRRKLGLTQAQLAKKANMPRTTITKVESGSYNPTLHTLMIIASALDKKLKINLI